MILGKLRELKAFPLANGMACPICKNTVTRVIKGDVCVCPQCGVLFDGSR